MHEKEQDTRLLVWRYPITGPAKEDFVGTWFVSDESLTRVYTVHTTQAEAFAYAWARTHRPKEN